MPTLNLTMRVDEIMALYPDVIGTPTDVVLWDYTINRQADYVIGDGVGLTDDATLTYKPYITDESRNTQFIVKETYYVAGDTFYKGVTINFTLIGLNDTAKTLFGTTAANVMKGGNLSDTIKGGAGNDTLFGYASYDRLYGGTGNDKLYGGDATDRLTGDSGNDKLYGEKGNDNLSGGSGNDTLDGGTGNDFMLGDSGNDKLSGGTGNDFLSGGAGKDTLQGGTGNDRLMGGTGADKLIGGTGADVFIFRSLKDSTTSASGRDTILDFDKKDTIDVRGIDAVSKGMTKEDFDFIGTSKFHKVSGELRYEKSKGDTFVYGDVNGDGKADFSIKLEGEYTLTKGDFLL